jgi:hypothetical protein
MLSAEALDMLTTQRARLRVDANPVPIEPHAPAPAEKRARRSRVDPRSLGTSSKCAGPVSTDACSAKAKQACPRDRSALSEVVHSRSRPSVEESAAFTRKGGAPASCGRPGYQ